MGRDATERWITAPHELAEAAGAGAAPELTRDAPERRAARIGFHALSEAELLALLLGPQRPASSRLALALDLLARVGGLRALLILDTGMMERLGLSPEAALKVQAVAEIERRVAVARIEERPVLSEPRDIAGLLARRFQHEIQEVMGVLFLDQHSRLIALRELFRGARDRLQIDPGLILREALLLNATKLIVFHTHPSGDLTPSAEDIYFTRRFTEAASHLGIKCLDHFVLARPGRWISLRDRCAL